METSPAEDAPRGSSDRTLSSETLAALIVDALVEAGIIAEARFDEAIAVAAEEIKARKALGDY
jgi:hypothetical protein